MTKSVEEKIQDVIKTNLVKYMTISNCSERISLLNKVFEKTCIGLTQWDHGVENLQFKEGASKVVELIQQRINLMLKEEQALLEELMIES